METKRRIYVPFTDVASLDSDGSSGHRIGCGAGHGRAGSTQTFTGKVSDAMCGAKHTEGNLAPAACVRDCVQKGAKYALVVGDKVYTLNTSDKAALDELNKLAWEQAKVTGTVSGDAISVKTVTASPKLEAGKRLL